MNFKLHGLFLSGAMLAIAGYQPIAEASSNTDGPAPTYFLPDFRPWYDGSSIGDIRFDTGHSNDRLVSCEDWTAVDPTPITGQRVLSFTLKSPNFGQTDLRLRRQRMPDGSIEMYQTVSAMDADGVCSAVEYSVPIAVIPSGSLQSGRWLPLAKFALYNIAEDGWLGDRVTCQIKRWCCLGSAARCPTRGPCPALTGGDDYLQAGAYDGYPFHWTDQFVPVEGVPTGYYWFEDEINPGGIMLESDYTNNSMFLLIYVDQENRQVTVVQEPDSIFSQCPGAP